MEISNATLVERLRKLSPSVISDVLDISGYPEQSLSGAIRPLVPTMRLAGPAMCFSGVSEMPGDTTPALSSYEIDQRIAPGMIVLIAANGDLVIGDADGVMVIPQGIASDIIAWAERLAGIEENIVAGLNAGAPREQVFAANPRFEHIRRLK